MAASVAKALTRHGAHAMLTETPSASSNIPPALQNLPPGYSIQEVPVTSGPPSVAFSSFSSGTLNNSNNMEMMMKLFIEKMDERMTQQEEALKNFNKPNNKRPNNDTSYRSRRNTSKYCYTHGACAHSSCECKNKKMGIRTRQL